MQMNLPNYFLADLPPEAALSPMMIRAAADTLKRNREKFLLTRSTEEIVKILCDVGAEWLRSDSPFRRLALDLGPSQTGFSKPVLERGLDLLFSHFNSNDFQLLLQQDLGHAQRLDQFVADGEEEVRHSAIAVGPKFLVHVAAGNIPNPTLTSITLGLLTRSAQFVKCATGASLIPRLFAHSIYEHDRKLGACLELAEWRGGKTELENALYNEADCLTVTGSDQTLAAVRAQLPQQVRFIGYGQRVSFSFVAREILREEEIEQIVVRAADDIVAWDQNGCLSPHVIYVEEKGGVESDKFAGLLAAELAKREDREPRGRISTEEAAAIASRRSMYQALSVHRGDIKIWTSQDSTAWTVVFEHDVKFQFSCLNRFIYVKPVPDVNAVLQGVDEIRGMVSTVGIAAPPEKAKNLSLQFARWGVTRICSLGQMQNPPLSWRHDGRPALGDLITWVDWEY